MRRTRKFLAILGAVLLVATVCGLASFASTDTTPSLTISNTNLSFSDSVFLLYAMKIENADSAEVQMLYWTEPKASTEAYVKGTESSHSMRYGFATVNGERLPVFRYDALRAKNMTDVIYARAYIEIDGVAHYSEVKKYSILEYAYNKLGYTGTVGSDTLQTLLTEMLQYGAAAQTHFSYNTDRLATNSFYKVELTAGMLDDGCTHGLYLAGDKVTMTAPATDAECATFAYWANSKGAKIGTTATYELTVGNKNESYTPVYVKYSAGLEFESNGDGTCCLLGMGDCTDMALVIPPTALEGDRVTEIDGSAFAGEAITSVSFPSTITSIGRKSFNDCSSLTDVYFDGTEAEWLEIDIGTYNDPIENATKHFNEPAVETFTVTFVDHDGTVLKTETVESGKGATAPADPARENYTFTGWDQAFDAVTGDLTVTAQYTFSTSAPTIVVSDATASAGETVTVAVQIYNNPGVAGAKLTVNFDSKLTLTAATSGEAFSELDYTPPATFVDGCPFNWDSLDAETSVNGTVLTLTFTVADSALVGEELNISVSYVDGDIYNAALEDLSFEAINGTITVK